MIGFAVDAQIVQAVAAGQRVAGQQGRAPRAARAQERGPARAKQIAVAQLVDRVLEVQAPQQRIGRHLRGADDVAAAVGLDLREREQLAQAPVGIGPHPSVNGPHDPIERGAARCSHDMAEPNTP